MSGPNAFDPPTARRPWHAGLTARLIGATVGVVMGVVVTAATLSYLELRRMAMAVADRTLTAQVGALSSDLESRLLLLRSDVQTMAANDLIANALVDDVGRAVYLRSFLGGITSAEGFPLAVTMTNFEGVPLATNGLAHEPPPAADWLAGVVETSAGDTLVEADETGGHLLFAEPIIFRNTGTAEGALVYHVRLADWLTIDRVRRILDENPWVASLSVSVAPAAGAAPVTLRHGTDPGDAPAASASVALPGPTALPPITLTLKARPDFVSAPLDHLLRSVSLGSVALLFAATLLVAYLVRRQTRKLARLRQESGNLKKPGAPEVHFTSEGKDEIDDLADSFNTLVGDLQTAYRRLEDRSAERVRLSEQRFRDFSDVGSDWFWEMDADLRFSYFSEQFESVASVAPALLLGKTRRETGIPGVDPEAWEAHLAALDARRPFRNFIHPRTRPDGQVLWLSISGKPYYDRDGTFLGYRGVGKDITAETVAHRQLLDLSAAFDAMPEPVAVFDSDDRYLFTNAAYRSLNTAVADTIQPGTRFEDHLRAIVERGLIPEATGQEDAWLTMRMARHLDPGGPVEVRRQDGLWYLGIEQKLPSGGRVLLLTDVTGLKAVQEELTQAKTEAETANQAKSLFLSSMSHELRTPLNAIMGFGQLLESDPDHPLTDEQRGAVDHILRGGRHLLGLINQVLDLAKVESGTLALSIEPVDVAPVVMDCLTMAAAMAAKRKIAVKTDMAKDRPLPAIAADPTRLRQVIINLLSNAVKYNVDGGTVTLACTRSPGLCRFSVTDTGPGIDEAYHDKVFTPFHRLGAEGGTVEGTGIGLAITRQLVELMGGTIGFSSVVGEGTTFWFELPLADPAAAPARTGAEKDKPHAEAALIHLPACSVLYIEDNPANLELMGMILGRVGDLTLHSAPSAEIGIALAEQIGPDLILMDINLPGMSGLAALGVLRRNPATADIPVVAVSANAMPNDIRAAKDAGFESYITKPFDIPDVIGTIADVLGRRFPVDPAAEGPAIADDATTAYPPLEAADVGKILTAAAAFPPSYLDILKRQAESLPALATAISRAVDDGNAGAAETAAHTLKTNSATFGARTLWALSQEIETSARDARLDRIAGLIGAMEHDIAAVAPVIGQLLADLGGTR